LSHVFFNIYWQQKNTGMILVLSVKLGQYLCDVVMTSRISLTLSRKLYMK